MTGNLDPEGVEARVLHDLVDFRDKAVLEIGCGDGRMTWLYADAAASVLAIDPDEPSIATALEETLILNDRAQSGECDSVDSMLIACSLSILRSGGILPPH